MKTGIVLEGGALRTIFSSGVCDALVEADLLPDYVVGVSAGIAYGVSYVSRQPRRNLEILLKYANDKRYMSKRNLFKPSNRCYFGLKFTYEEIPNRLVPFDYETFAAFPGEVEAVVTNLETGGPEYIPVPRRDDQFQVLQATCAMPLLFPIYHINGIPCLDGGSSDGIPYGRAVQKRCDRIVVVLTRERDYRRTPEQYQALVDLRYRRYPNFRATMHSRAERYNACREELFRLEKEGKVILLAPKSTQGFSRIEKDVDKIKALWQDGYDLGRARAEEIRAFWGRS
ncbi:MAG TPA: patatin family protein [Candidatus Intestinimonas pullistercoris]|uniref:Patatin family protein n=1 Tax=Candidatus Intestinimonas pullistercoris TaxID=2838623 RepID=A0A9D2P1P0_9FIRM|nr:patatin family protein [Candidatus Intestinimonas pullistercoris]